MPTPIIPPQTEIRRKKKLKEVFDRFDGDPSEINLISAYDECVRQDCGFIGNLISISGIEGSPPNEFKGIEYEIKLDVQVSGEVRSEFPQQYLDTLQKKMSVDSGFLSANVTSLARHSENYYFGKNSDDLLVVMRGGGMTSLKYKGGLERLSVGLEDEEFVFKRGEKIDRGCSDEEVLKEVQRVTLEGGRYQGKIFRNRARTDFLSIPTGRLYTVIFDICEVFREGTESFKKRQIEAEYVGYIPDLFKGFREGSEKQIAEDLLKLAKAMQENFIGAKPGRTRIKDLQFTSERKYDFLTG